MRLGKTNRWLMLAIGLTELGLLTMSSFAFAHTSTSMQNGELSLFASSIKGEATYCYVNLDLRGGSVHSVSDTLFQNTFSENFSNSSTRVLAVSDENGIASFDALFDDRPLPYPTAAASGKNYTNNEELVRMETVCINLFEYRERRDEHEYDPGLYDGFIYIPDYYADYIIENYLPGMSYHDFIADSANHSFAISINGNAFKYRIANIFHVRGFKKERSGERELVYNDYGTGAKLDSFFDGYCFISNHNHYWQLKDGLHTTVVCQSNPKKYELKEFIQIGSSYAQEYAVDHAHCDTYSLIGKDIKRYERSSQLSDAFFTSSSGLSIWATIFVGLFGMAYALGLWSIAKGWISLGNARKSFLLLLGETTGYMLASYLLKLLLPGSLSIQLFFNIPSMIVVCAVFIVLFVLFFTAKRERGEA